MNRALPVLAVLSFVANAVGLLAGGTTSVLDGAVDPLPVSVPVVKGSLCFSDVRQCSATKGLRFEVPAVDRVRRYVWTSDDHRTIFAGEVAANGTVIDLASKDTPLRTISLAVRGDANRGWPADADITFSESKDKEWKWQLPAEMTGREVKIHLPVSNYVLFIQAPRHSRFGRRLPPDKELALGTIELTPVPSIHGRVVRLDEERGVAVAGAQILAGDGKLAGTTNEQGMFRIELSGPVTDILIASPGFGTKVIKLAQLETENDLGEIRLESGVALTLHVERPEDLRNEALQIRFLRQDKLHKHVLLATRELGAGEDEVTFADVAAGPYYAVLEGDSSLERLLVPIEIGHEDVSKKVILSPFRLKGRVLFGEEPLRKGVVEIYTPGPAQTAWRARLDIEPDGSFGGDLWQGGRLKAIVHRSSGGGVLRGESPELGSDPSVWTLAFKDRMIHGRVVDAESGAAPQGIRFDLKTTGRDGGSRSSVDVASNGEYRIDAWEDGTYDLIVSARDLLPETKTLELTEMDGSRKVDFALERGHNAKLEFFWASGQRILAPNVYEGVARDGRNPERHHRPDAAGVLNLSLREGESRMLFVVPAEGSFAPVRVTAGRSSDDPPLRVHVPPGTGTLRVRLKNMEPDAAEPFVVIRYNGEWIPWPVSARLRTNSAPGVIEFLTMPAGAYELWAVRPGPGQPPPIMAPAHGPVRAGVTVGETNVEVPVVSLP